MLLFPYLRTVIRRYLGGTLFLLVTNCFALLIPWFMKLAIDSLQSPSTARFSLSSCAIIIALLALAHGITRIFSRTLILNAARIIEYDIRNDLFSRLMLLDMRYFSAKRTGDISSRFTNDLSNVRMLTGFGVMSAVNTVIIYIAVITLMLRIHPWLTFAALLPFPLMIMLVKIISQRLFQRSVEAQEELAKLSSISEESVSSVRLIKSYCREGHFRELFGTISDRYLETNLRLARLRGLIMPVMAAATGSSTLVVLFLGGRFVINAAMTLGDFVAFSGYLAMLVWPTAVIGWFLTLAQRGAASMSRLAVILQAESEIADTSDAKEILQLKNGIEFRSLSFSYEEEKILEEVTFSISAGEKIGITGEVGSGKTTLLRLLPRLLSIPDGMLFIDGYDVNRIKTASLRKLIGYVPQEAFLFSRTIRENIGYSLTETIDQEAIIKAVRQAGFSEDIDKFHDGLETLVGEKGVTLSGGQKQRVAIARALVSNPEILLFDDPLAAVDAGREETILAEMENFCAGRTVLIVSHRLSAFRNCDRVILLKNGKIAEHGEPDKLLAENGLYAEMYRMQRLEEELF